MVRKLCVLLAFSLTFLALPAVAAPPPHLNWGTRISNTQCDPHQAGPPVININRRVLNSIDSGFGADIWWAHDDYKQKVTVYAVDGNTWCVVSSFQGRFDAFAGFDTPNDDGHLSGDERGSFQGGYHAVIEGELKPRGDFGWPARGFAGTFDYACDPQASRGAFPPVCPGSVDLFGQYFESGYSLSYEWWGWIYRGGRAGTFVNASDGSVGDIKLD